MSKPYIPTDRDRKAALAAYLNVKPILLDVEGVVVKHLATLTSYYAAYWVVTLDEARETGLDASTCDRVKIGRRHWLIDHAGLDDDRQENTHA
jgi:hypothetical protein